MSALSVLNLLPNIVMFGYLPIQQVLSLEMQLLVCTEEEKGALMDQTCLHLSVEWPFAQLGVDLIQFLNALFEVFLRQDAIQSECGKIGPIHLQFRKEPLEECECIGECSSNLILTLLLEGEEVTSIEELAPFSPQRPSLLALVKGLLDMIVGIDGEVFDEGLTMWVVLLHEGSQSKMVNDAPSSEEAVEQSENGDLPAIRVLHQLLSVKELYGAVVDWIRDLNGDFLVLQWLLCLHTYSYQLLQQEESYILQQPFRKAQNALSQPIPIAH